MAAGGWQQAAAQTVEEEAQAQAASTTASPTTIEAIVVTAQRRAENLQDVPVTITAATAEALEAAGINDQRSLQVVTPGLVVAATSHLATPFVRGVGSVSGSNPGLEGATSIYFDDQYIPRAHSGLTDFVDLDRVEVVKGPQGALYGRNVLGGAIRIISNDPKPQFGITARAGVGSFNRRAASVTVNAPITETLAARGTIAIDKRDGWIDNVDPRFPDLMSRDLVSGNAKLLWEPTDQLTVKLSYFGTYKNDFEGAAYLPYWNRGPEQTGIVRGGTPRTGFYQTSQDEFYPGREFRMRLQSVALRADYDLGDITLSSITGYVYNSAFLINETDTVNIPLAASSSFDRTQNFTQEFQAVSNFAGPLNFVAGLFYFKEDSGTMIARYGTGQAVQAGGFGDIEITSIAPYFQGTWEVNDQLKVTLGGRYTHEKKSVLNRPYTGPNELDAVGLPVGPLIMSPDTFSDDLKFEKFTPKASVSYDVNDDLMLYASYGQGFRSGGFGLPATAQPDKTLPETLDAYEAGWKWSGSRFRLNGAAFYYDWKDVLVSILNVGVRLENAASATIKGAELEGDFQVTDNLRLSGGLAYTDAKYEEYVGQGWVRAADTAACQALGGYPTSTAAACVGFAPAVRDFSGRSLPNSPKWSGNIRATYDLPLPDNWGSLSATGIVAYIDEAYFDPAGMAKNPSRTLLNANLMWTSPDERWTANLVGRNLTEKEYYSQIFVTNQGGWYTPAEPRTIDFTVTYRF